MIGPTNIQVAKSQTQSAPERVPAALCAADLGLLSNRIFEPPSVSGTGLAYVSSEGACGRRDHYLDRWNRYLD